MSAMPEYVKEMSNKPLKSACAASRLEGHDCSVYIACIAYPCNGCILEGVADFIQLLIGLTCSEEKPLNYGQSSYFGTNALYKWHHISLQLIVLNPFFSESEA